MRRLPENCGMLNSALAFPSWSVIILLFDKTTGFTLFALMGFSLLLGSYGALSPDGVESAPISSWPNSGISNEYISLVTMLFPLCP